MAFHSTQGPQLGLPQMIQSRPQFGYTGALLVWGVALIAYIGYNAFNQVLAGQALHQLYRCDLGDLARVIDRGLRSLAVALAAVGYDKIHLAQRALRLPHDRASSRCSRCGGVRSVHLPPSSGTCAAFAACRSWRSSSPRPPIS